MIRNRLTDFIRRLTDFLLRKQDFKAVHDPSTDVLLALNNEAFRAGGEQITLTPEQMALVDCGPHALAPGAVVQALARLASGPCEIVSQYGKAELSTDGSSFHAKVLMRNPIADPPQAWQDEEQRLDRIPIKVPLPPEMWENWARRLEGAGLRVVWFHEDYHKDAPPTLRRFGKISDGEAAIRFCPEWPPLPSGETRLELRLIFPYGDDDAQERCLRVCDRVFDILHPRSLAEPRP